MYSFRYDVAAQRAILKTVSKLGLYSDVEIFDLRIFLGDPLPASTIESLANAPTEPLKDEYKCAQLFSESISDTSWTNGFGHNCAWFFEHNAQNPGTLCF
jgi:hypothetical protein